MKRPGFKVTSPVVYSLVEAIFGYCTERDAYELWDLLKEIGEKENEVLTAHVLDQLIALFTELGEGKGAMEVFNKFGDFGFVPSTDTYFFCIQYLLQMSIYDWAWSICRKMLDEDRLLDGEQLDRLIHWFCRWDKVKDAHAVYLFAKEKKRHLPSYSLYYLICALSQKDESETVKLALEMLDGYSGEARKRAITPFSSVVQGLCRTKNADEAKALLHKMIVEGPRPGIAVFKSAVNACCEAGDMDKAKEMIKLMEDTGLKPNPYSYTVVMSGHADAGQMDEACQVLAEAKRKKVKLSRETYHTLIRGYCKIEEFDNALKLLAEMKNPFIGPLCSEVLDWQTAVKLLDKMEENGLFVNKISKGVIKERREEWKQRQQGSINN